MPALFSALKHRNFRLFISGNLISLIGSWMQTMALSWLTYRITHSPFLLGLVGFANAIPLLVVSPLAGVFVDRFSKRKILFFTQTGMMLSAFCLAFLTEYGHIQIWHLFLFTIIGGALGGLDAPARLSFVVEMVGKEDLMNAIAMNSMAFNAARIIGPSIAGFLVIIIHESGCFFLNGISFIAVLIGLALLRLPPHIIKTHQESYRENLLAGIRYVRTSRVLCGLLALVTVPSILTLSYATLMPVFAKDIFGKKADGMGILLSCVGVGAILGALFVARISHSKFKGKVLLVGNLGSNLFILCFGLSHFYYLSCAILICVGVFNVMYLTTTNTLIQSNSQDEYRGRAVSFYTLIFQGMMPIGSLVMGTLASWFSAPTTIASCAIVTMLYSIYINKKFPELEKLP